MLNKKLKRGFTLIELLVVITIIGILATGAVAVYTAQIQKARDSTRINDLKAIQSGVEQVYQDSWEYPHSDEFADWSATDWRTWVKTYVELIPRDSKFGQPCNNWWNATTPVCWYVYWVDVDSNGIEYWEYELSTAFENSWNVWNKANNTKDHGSDDNRFEIWINVISTGSHDTSTDTAAFTSTSSWCMELDWTTSPSWTSSIILADDC